LSRFWRHVAKRRKAKVENLEARVKKMKKELAVATEGAKRCGKILSDFATTWQWAQGQPGWDGRRIN